MTQITRTQTSLGDAPEIPFAEKRSGNRYLTLQWARIAACVMVLVFHATLYIGGQTTATYYRGAKGVDVFFVLSGFVIFTSSRKLENIQRGWRTFARHRLLRILPMYWLITTLNLLLIMVEAKARGRTLPNGIWVLSSYLFIPYHSAAHEAGPVLSVGWTLEFEMLFYLLCVTALFLCRRLLPSTLVALVALAIGSLWRNYFQLELFRFLDPIVLEFGLGICIAWLSLRRLLPPTWLAWPLIYINFFLLCCWPWPGMPNTVLTAGIPAAVLLYCLAAVEASFLRTPRWILVLADSTYLLYLIHVPIILEFSKAAGRMHLRWQVVVMLVAGAASITVALLLRVFVEVPLLSRLQDRPSIGHS